MADNPHLQQFLQPSSSDSDSSEDIEDIILHSSDASDSGNDSDDDDDNNAEYPVMDPLLPPLLNLLLHGRRRAKMQDYLAVVHDKSDEDFRRDYRLRRDVAYTLIDRLAASGHLPNQADGRPKTSAEVCFLLYLWYVGNTEPLRTLADRFDLSESSVFRIIRRVAGWLVTLVPETVVWPRGQAVQQTYEKFQHMPKCLGAVDGSFIFICKPLDNPRDFWCRKKAYALNLTAICNAEKKFTMLYVGEPGSFHDIHVFRNSPFYAELEQNMEDVLPDGTYIIGDGAYIGLNPRWMVIPFRDNGVLTMNQLQFNNTLSSDRVVIEHAFGLLKGRFRRLLGKVYLFDHDFATDVILSCCVLHNICLDTGDEGEDEWDPGAEGGNDNEEGEDQNGEEENAQGPVVFADEDLLNALGRRAVLFRQMFGPGPGHVH